MVKNGSMPFFVDHRDRVEFPENEPPLADYLRAVNLDPLGMDETMAILPELNNGGHREAVVAAVDQAFDRAENLFFEAEIDGVQISRPVALAALRDLDFLIGSGIRHGFDYSAESEEKSRRDEILGALASITQTVPRGTVFTYATANPTGARERSFTGDPQEAAFIESARLGCTSLDEAVRMLCGVEFESHTAASDLQRLLAANAALALSIQSMQDARARVSPQWFSEVLRPYFDPVDIGGQRYLAPGGAQMPLLIADKILWANPENDETYASYFDESVPYCDIAYRAMLEEALSRPNTPLLQAALMREAAGRGVDAPEDPLLDALLETFAAIQTFRSIHRIVAKKSFGSRPEGAVGSGGLTTDILEYLTQKTKYGRNVLRALLREKILGLHGEI